MELVASRSRKWVVHNGAGMWRGKGGLYIHDSNTSNSKILRDTIKGISKFAYSPSKYNKKLVWLICNVPARPAIR